MRASVSGSIAVRQGCIMFLWLFNVYMDAVMKGENGEEEDGSEISGGRREWRLPGLLYADVSFCMVSRKKT